MANARFPKIKLSRSDFTAKGQDVNLLKSTEEWCCFTI